MADAKEVGRRLQEARDRKGLTQEEAAKLLEMHAITLSNIEQGKRRRPPGGDVLAKAAAVYGVPVAELLGEPAELSDVARATLDEWRAATARRLRAMADEIEQGKVLAQVPTRSQRETIAKGSEPREEKPTG